MMIVFQKLLSSSQPSRWCCTLRQAGCLHFLHLYFDQLGSFSLPVTRFSIFLHVSHVQVQQLQYQQRTIYSVQPVHAQWWCILSLKLDIVCVFMGICSFFQCICCQWSRWDVTAKSRGTSSLFVSVHSPTTGVIKHQYSALCDDSISASQSNNTVLVFLLTFCWVCECRLPRHWLIIQ